MKKETEILLQMMVASIVIALITKQHTYCWGMIVGGFIFWIRLKLSSKSEEE